MVARPDMAGMLPLEGLTVPETVGDTVLDAAGPAEGTLMPGALTVCWVVGDVVAEGPDRPGMLPLPGFTVPDVVGDMVLGVAVPVAAPIVPAGLTVCWDVGDGGAAGV